MSLLLSAREVSAFKKFPREMVSFWPLPPLTWGENHHWKKQLSFHVLFVSFNVAAIIPALCNSRIPGKKYALFVLEICVTSFPKKAYFPAFYQSPFFFFLVIFVWGGDYFLFLYYVFATQRMWALISRSLETNIVFRYCKHVLNMVWRPASSFFDFTKPCFALLSYCLGI